MKILSNNKKTRIVILSIIAMVIVLLGLYILEKTRVTNFIKDPTYHPSSTGATPEQKSQDQQVAASQKEDFIDATSGKTTAPQPQPAKIPTDEASITLAATQSNDTVTFVNELNGQGYSSGSCKLTVTNGAKSIKQNAEIIYQPEFSMCAGFSVPVNGLGAGTWNAILEVTPFNGQPLSKSISLKVQ